MDVVDSLRPDSILEETNHLEAETPRQDPQRTCTRNLPCLQWGCMICNTPINHVRNLDLALNTDHGPQASPIPTDRQPPPNHTILFLTTSFQLAIQENDIAEITAINKLYSQTLKSNLDFILYDRSNLRAIQQTALNLLNSHVAASTPLPAPSVPPPSASFKPPKLVTDNWSGLYYDFYLWLSSILNGFTLTRWESVEVVSSQQDRDLTRVGQLAVPHARPPLVWHFY